MAHIGISEKIDILSTYINFGQLISFDIKKIGQYMIGPRFCETKCKFWKS